jgi:hypothetical protein
MLKRLSHDKIPIHRSRRCTSENHARGRGFANCKALGNIDLDAAAAGIDNAENHAIGLGGDTVLDTTPTSIYGTITLLRTGVIDRCGPALSPASK